MDVAGAVILLVVSVPVGSAGAAQTLRDVPEHRVKPQIKGTVQSIRGHLLLYLLHPKNGGVAQLTPMNQVKATAARAWLLPNLKAPNGLQMTRYRSKDKTARDQAVTRPEEDTQFRCVIPKISTRCRCVFK